MHNGTYVYHTSILYYNMQYTRVRNVYDLILFHINLCAVQRVPTIIYSILIPFSIQTQLFNNIMIYKILKKVHYSPIRPSACLDVLKTHKIGAYIIFKWL